MQPLVPGRLAAKWRRLMANPPPVTYGHIPPWNQPSLLRCAHATPTLSGAFVNQSHQEFILQACPGLSRVSTFTYYSKLEHSPDLGYHERCGNRAETRPDIVDRTEHRVSDYDEFLRKKREMKLFGAAIDGFESDPEFNPLTVMLAHSLTKYGIPPPESDDIGVWQSWYTEVLDRYHVSNAAFSLFWTWLCTKYNTNIDCVASCLPCNPHTMLSKMSHKFVLCSLGRLACFDDADVGRASGCISTGAGVWKH